MMKSVFNNSVREELASRISSLTPESQGLWGKMNVQQMINHCMLCDEMVWGERHIKRVFIGKLLGRFFLKSALKNEKPFGKNSPTSPLLLSPADAADMKQQQTAWIDKIHHYANYGPAPRFIHPFFGKMTTEQIGVFAYKHADHHLRQFGV